MTKNKKGNGLAAEIIFWLHTTTLLIITFLGLFIAWYWVVLVLVLVKIQQKIFHGCILTLWEVKERRLKKGTSCFYLTFKRFFGIRLSRRGIFWVSLIQNLASLVIAVGASLLNFRIHL